MKTKTQLQKKTYRVKNWSKYNQALKQRGSLIVWIDKDIKNKWKAKPTGKQGSQPIYSNFAITTTLQFGKIFHQRLRQTQGLMESILSMTNIKLPVPDYSTLSRRGEKLNIILSKKKRKGKIDLVLDSTGLKVYGEGEWKTRQHGKSKRRTWRKIHIGITPDGKIRLCKLTDNKAHDSIAGQDLLVKEQSKINKIIGDGGYDTWYFHTLCQAKGIKNIIIPPAKNAKILRHGNCKSPPYSRDENLRQIRKTSRRTWKQVSGYHTRSLVETAIYRFKRIFSDKLDARNFKQQITETMIKARILNKMTELGMPDSYATVPIKLKD